MKFPELIRTRYIEPGIMSADGVACMLRNDASVSRNSALAAIAGKRVSPETAQRLRQWGVLKHSVEVDFEAMVLAPAKGAT